MALLDLLTELAKEKGFTVTAAHFNHHLRPTADRDAIFVSGWCAERKIHLVSGGADVGAAARAAGRNIEDTGRALRYQFLDATADQLGAERIATAHHREDNAETVLLHLLRGSGLRGLSGIPPVRGRIVRPLLEICRTAIDQYVAARHIPYVEDETNGDPAYTRNRLRLEVLPLLEEVFPGCRAHLAAAADLLRADAAYLEDAAAALLPDSPDTPGLPLASLWEQPLAMQRRLVRLAAERQGVALNREAVEAVLHLRRGGCLYLSGGARACRTADRLLFQLPDPVWAPVELHTGEQTWGSWRVRVATALPPFTSPRRAVLDREKLPSPLSIAAWDGKGRLAVENGGMRTIKRLFTDCRIPPGQRDAYPALYMDGRCIAVPGVAVDAALTPGEGRPVLVVDVWRDVES